MLKVEKIQDKVELLDMEVQATDPCKHFWVNNGWAGMYDCLSDCKDKTKKASDAY